VENIKDMEIIL